MKMKIAVCDDDRSQRHYLKEIVLAWAKRNCHLVELKQYANAEAFLFDFAEEKDFDILLLDVEMQEINGVALAKKVRRENQVVQIIFVTGFYEYFGDGFDVSALHYLIKPIDAAKLEPVLDRAVNGMTLRKRSVLVVTQEGSVKIPLADILYIEAERVYIVVHTMQGNYRTRITLLKFCAELDDTFFKIHRSFVVGLMHIKIITKTSVTLINGDLLPISRGMYDKVHAALIKYL